MVWLKLEDYADLIGLARTFKEQTHFTSDPLFLLVWLMSNIMSFKRDVSLDQLSLLPAAQQEEILNGPALQPPLGILPNFEDPPNGNAITHFTIAICLVLTTAGFLLRTYSRIFRTGKFEIEDCKSPSTLLSRKAL